MNATLRPTSTGDVRPATYGSSEEWAFRIADAEAPRERAVREWLFEEMLIYGVGLATLAFVLAGAMAFVVLTGAGAMLEAHRPAVAAPVVYGPAEPPWAPAHPCDGCDPARGELPRPEPGTGSVGKRGVSS